MDSNSIDNFFNNDERSRIIFDSMPLSCNFWNRNHQLIDCNTAALALFEISNKQEYLENFENISPTYQLDGSPSNEKINNLLEEAFEKGYLQERYMHQKLSGEPILTEKTLVRIEYNGEYFVITYTRDLRNPELKRTVDEIERLRCMLDATPLACNFWDENLNNIDCNQEAVLLFGLNSKQEFCTRFNDLSPEYQPDGMLSSVKAVEKIRHAFQYGRIRFEWMHQTLDGKLIPAEITLVPVFYHNQNVIVGYMRDLREIKETISMLNEFEILAFSDPLTGVFNRRYFMETAGNTFKTSKSHNKPFTFIMFDLDHFKKVNDTYGHLVGDEVLKHIVNTTKYILRSSEIIARYGGEEFLIMVSDEVGNAAKLAERIRFEIDESNFIHNGLKIHTTISLGVAGIRKTDTNIEEILQRADSALYAAKNRGRNCFGVEE